MRSVLPNSCPEPACACTGIHAFDGIVFVFTIEKKHVIGHFDKPDLSDPNVTWTEQ